MLTLATVDRDAVGHVLRRYGLQLELVAGEIPGSYWGESEAGLRAHTLYARPDTPLHSVLHEAAHFVCMTSQRRAVLDRDAGGDDAEEAATCYLQVLLAQELIGIGGERMASDMDAWGYSFRQGSTRAWLEGDAQDARCWLLEQGILLADGTLSGSLRR